MPSPNLGGQQGCARMVANWPSSGKYIYAPWTAPKEAYIHYLFISILNVFLDVGAKDGWMHCGEGRGNMQPVI